MIIQLVKYDIDFLNLSWKWLNDSDLKQLTDTPDFSKNQQKNGLCQ